MLLGVFLQLAHFKVHDGHLGHLYYIIVYLDFILILSPTLEQVTTHLNIVFMILSKNMQKLFFKNKLFAQAKYSISVAL